MTQDEQLEQIRATIFAMANALGAALQTPEVRKRLDELVQASIEATSS